MLFSKRNLPSFYIFSFIFFVFGFYQAYKWKWICDDAYISFVYARNFYEGSGLVFNLGERVEGYTNFLWTLFLSSGFAIGIKPQHLSIGAGIFFYLSTLFVFFWEENRISLGKIYPLLVVHLALFFHLYIFATSGLETSVFTFFICFGLLLWEKQSWFLLPVFFLSALVRPEGALFLFVASLDLIFRKQDWKPFVFGILFLCFLGFRYFYYQDILPNTFYAKGNKGAYFLQGAYYFLYFAQSYPIYLLVLLIAGIQIYQSLRYKKEFRFLLASVLLYILYVFYVGGDFMGNRFWIPILPYLSYLAFVQISEWDLNSQIESNQSSLFTSLYIKNRLLVSFFFILSTAVYTDPLKIKGTRIPDWHGIVEERMFYENHLIRTEGYDVDALADSRVAFFGAQAHFIYYLRPAFAFEAESGLTDREFAKKKVETRGRIGHEGELTKKDLVDRKIDILLDNRLHGVKLPHIQYTWRGVPIRFYVWNYDPIKFKRLCVRSDWNCDDLFVTFQSNHWDSNQPMFFGNQ
ncbi:putative membrane protein [Leptospira wolbachii serovar Codice str. CDC]|uniref:Membrane protein n=1 Tax=Leptospira wolbachii serovar Codice str. CDC TaxID=1218599 RepID=R9ABT5_9LEPT|nr:membrane protein [Leptospira wolbachii]EOQ97650.1 putative membrane protein [Leptospira wolbachii serovar Codice str. CDC]